MTLWQRLRQWWREWRRSARYAPDVQIHGNVVIGEGVHLSGPLDINGNDCQVVIGEGCDIGAFTAINCADSHMRCLGLSSRIERKPITLEHHIFVGTLCLIKGGVFIGHHSVVAGGSVVDMGIYPPYSLIYGSYPTQVKPKYYGAQCYPPRA